MGLKDKTISISAGQAVIRSITIYPQADGTLVLTAVGVTKDSEDREVPLSATVPFKEEKAIAAVLDLAISELRKANGLE